jgi:hypothetical protein
VPQITLPQPHCPSRAPRSPVRAVQLACASHARPCARPRHARREPRDRRWQVANRLHERCEGLLLGPRSRLHGSRSRLARPKPRARGSRRVLALPDTRSRGTLAGAARGRGARGQNKGEASRAVYKSPAIGSSFPGGGRPAPSSAGVNPADFTPGSTCRSVD